MNYLYQNYLMLMQYNLYTANMAQSPQAQCIYNNIYNYYYQLPTINTNNYNTYMNYLQLLRMKEMENAQKTEETQPVENETTLKKENKTFTGQKRKRKDNFDEANLAILNNNAKEDSDDSDYSETQSKGRKKKEMTHREERKTKSNVITHKEYQSTKSPEEFMKYNFNFDKDINYSETIEEDNFHVNKDKLYNNFCIVNNDFNVPKKVWNCTLHKDKELKKKLNKLERVWPNKLSDFNEEYALKIFTLCNYDYEKCKGYITSNEFKKELMKQKAKKEKEKSTINVFK